MKATELRIGNCVLEDGREIELSVYGLVDIDKNMQSTYLPIPLTEEWLKRFGLDDEQHFADNEYFSISGPINGSWDLKFERKYMGVDFEYVHQLQNLYFALTGTELELK